MPLETKKVLWTVLCVVIVLVVASGIALALAFPRGTSPGAPATVAAVSPPRSVSPDEYVRAVEPAPVPPPPVVVTPPATGSDIIVVYGEKPDATTITATGTTAAPAVTAKPYVPASSTGAPTGTATTKPLASTAPASTAAKPAAKPAAATKPATAAPAAPKSVAEYWIQAAAFTSRTRADDLQRELATKNLSSLITVKDLDGVTWYRVRIGPYNTEPEAKGWLGTIRLVAGCAEAYVSKQTVTR